MSKIDNPPIRDHSELPSIDTPLHIEHKGEPTRKELKSNTETQSTGLFSRSVAVQKNNKADKLCAKAHTLRENGEMAKAYLAYKEAAAQGSQEAKFWLGEVDRPFIQETAKEPNIQKPSVPFTNKHTLQQGIILQKFSAILNQLQELNPQEYDSKTIDKIIHEFTEGHCSGFALYFLQLALTKNPESTFDRTEEMTIMLQKICDWDGELFEPPEGFSYEKDYPNLSDNDKKSLTFTNDLKEFISIIRFAQHVYHEDIEDERTQLPRNVMTRTSSSHSEKFNANTDFFHNLESYVLQYNFDFILGDHFVTKMKLQAFNPTFRIDAFIDTLRTYLTETNAAHITINVDELHAMSIIYREGKYYLFDSNTTSQEESFDPRYSARSYDTLEALNQDIKSVYRNPSDDFGPDYLTSLTIIERKGSENFYLNDKEEYERLDMIKLNKLSKSLTDDQFNQLLHQSMETDPYDLDLQSMDSSLYYLFPSLFFKNAKTILHNSSERGHVRSLIQAAPLMEFTGIDLFGYERNSFNDLGYLYATPHSSLYNPTKAFQFFQLAAHHNSVNSFYNLAICYYLGFGIEKNEDLAITHLLKAADKGDVRAMNMIGYFFNDEQKQILESPHFMDYLLQAASDAVENATYNVGIIYLAGLFGQEKDANKAFKYLRSEELSQNPDALLLLSNIYYNELNEQFMGLRYLQKAADLGNPIAQLGYGHELVKSNSDNDPDILNEAMYYYQLAAEQGNPEAQFYLGAHLYKRRASDEEYDYAIHYLTFSANQGNEEAINLLAAILHNESEM